MSPRGAQFDAPFVRAQEPSAHSGGPAAPKGHPSRREGDECPARLSVTTRERDALYFQGLRQLPGFQSFKAAIDDKDEQRVERLACQFTEDQRFLGALDWGNDSERIELPLSPEELRRTLVRLRDGATKRLVAGISEAQSREIAAMAALTSDRLIEACDRLLEAR